MEISTGIAVIAILISFWSIYTTKILWFMEHRPIVTAEVTVDSSGVGTALLNFVICNSGNRPATNIHFYAEKDDIEKLLSKGAEKRHYEEINNIFSKNIIVPLLINGESAKTAFFSFSNNTINADILVCNASIPIKIYYSDIKNKNYISNIQIAIKDKDGFGGSVWE